MQMQQEELEKDISKKNYIKDETLKTNIHLKRVQKCKG